MMKDNGENNVMVLILWYINYFRTLILRGNITVDAILNCLERRVTDIHNASLVSPLDTKEVKAAIFLRIGIRPLGRMDLI